MDTASGIYGQQHLLRASLYRKQLAARFVAWREITEVTRNPSYAF
jgi:putative transposase